VTREWRQLPWPRLAAESAAIVASILLAFAIDAWWADRGETNREQEILGALLDDFRASRDEIDRWLAYHRAAKETATRLLQVATGEGDPVSAAEFDRFLSDLTWIDPRRHFTTLTLDAVIAGGEIALIRDDDLRRQIADWPSRIEAVAFTQRQEVKFFEEVWMPFLVDRISLPQIDLAGGTHMPGNPQIQVEPVPLRLSDHQDQRQILRLPEFGNLLLWKRWIHGDTLLQFDSAMTELSRTIASLEDALGMSREP
jgi:hypothetical protein